MRVIFGHGGIIFGQAMRTRENLSLSEQYAQAVPARYLGVLVQKLERDGWPCDKVLRRHALHAADLLQEHARIPRSLLDKVLQALSALTGRSDLGFEIGALTNLRSVDVVGQLLLSASTLREGLARVAPLFALVSPSLRMHCQESGAGLNLVIRPSHPLPYDISRTVLEAVTIATHRLILFLTPEETCTHAMHVTWGPPPHAARYRALRRVKVKFGVEGETRVEFRLPATLVDAPLPMADSAALALAEAHCRRLLDELVRNRSWSEWVRYVLSVVEGRQVTAPDLAKLVNVSAKTLTRRLAEEGLSFRQLANEVRADRAKRLLLETDWSLGTIAERLGYSEVSNFGRAFEAQVGMRPGEFRASAGGADGSV